MDKKKGKQSQDCLRNQIPQVVQLGIVFPFFFYVGLYLTHSIALKCCDVADATRQE